MSKRAVVLIGSPKGLEGSSSARLARILAGRLEADGWSVDWAWLYRFEEERLLPAISSSDLVILSSPLYVDSLPAPVIRFMETAVDRFGAGPHRERPPRFVAVLNCGFLEPEQNATAERICRRFAHRARFEWYGAISLGCAGLIRKRIDRALKMAAGVLSEGFPVPPAVKRLTKRPVMPRLLYIIGGNLIWRRIARKNGLRKGDLLAQPYEPAPSRTSSS